MWFLFVKNVKLFFSIFYLSFLLKLFLDIDYLPFRK